MRRAWLAAAALMVLVACGGDDDTSTGDTEAATTPLEDAADDCHLTDGIRVADEGNTLISDGDLSAWNCVVNALDTPTAIVARMENTRAVDGMQEAFWGDYVASWTYHPDDGLQLVVEYQPA